MNLSRLFYQNFPFFFILIHVIRTINLYSVNIFLSIYRIYSAEPLSQISLFTIWISKANTRRMQVFFWTMFIVRFVWIGTWIQHSLWTEKKKKKKKDSREVESRKGKMVDAPSILGIYYYYMRRLKQWEHWRQHN